MTERRAEPVSQRPNPHYAPRGNPSSFGESLRKNDGMAVITVEEERERASAIQERGHGRP